MVKDGVIRPQETVKRGPWLRRPRILVLVGDVEESGRSADLVDEAVAVAERWDDDTRVVMFLRMDAGEELTEDLERRIRERLRTEESPRHVPAIITTVEDIPRTRSGKISELAVTAVVNGEAVKNTEALANPEALDLFAGRGELN